MTTARLFKQQERLRDESRFLWGGPAWLWGLLWDNVLVHIMQYNGGVFPLLAPLWMPSLMEARARSLVLRSACQVQSHLAMLEKTKSASSSINTGQTNTFSERRSLIESFFFPTRVKRVGFLVFQGVCKMNSSNWTLNSKCIDNINLLRRHIGARWSRI